MAFVPAARQQSARNPRNLFWLSDELQRQPRPLPVPPERLVPWACAQANGSVSDCAACEWWPLLEPLPAAARPLPPPTAAPEGRASKWQGHGQGLCAPEAHGTR